MPINYDVEYPKLQKRLAELEFKFSSKYWDEVGVEMMKLKAENQRLKEQLADAEQELTDLINRVCWLPLLLTDDEESCMAMHRMIENALYGDGYELQEDS